MRIQTTTELETIRKDPRRFTWGQVVQIHDLGRYTFVEYLKKNYEKESEFDDQPSFHVYVDGKTTNNSCDSLESAMVLAIARGKMEPNSGGWMAQAACKLLGIEI